MIAPGLEPRCVSEAEARSPPLGLAVGAVSVFLGRLLGFILTVPPPNSASQDFQAELGSEQLAPFRTLFWILHCLQMSCSDTLAMARPNPVKHLIQRS